MVVQSDVLNCHGCHETQIYYRGKLYIVPAYATMTLSLYFSCLDCSSISSDRARIIMLYYDYVFSSLIRLATIKLSSIRSVQISVQLSCVCYRDGVLDYKEFSSFLRGVFDSTSLTELPEDKLKKFMVSLDSNKV